MIINQLCIFSLCVLHACLLLCTKHFLLPSHFIYKLMEANIIQSLSNRILSETVTEFEALLRQPVMDTMTVGTLYFLILGKEREHLVIWIAYLVNQKYILVLYRNSNVCTSLHMEVNSQRNEMCQSSIDASQFQTLLLFLLYENISNL